MDVEGSQVELLVDAHARVGEGPVWHAESRTLTWVDVNNSLVHRYDPAGGRDTTFDVGQPVGAALPRASGGLVLCIRDGIASLDLESGRVEMLVEIEASDPGNRMNDANCDAAGRLWAGTMSFGETDPVGSLYRIDPDLRVTRVLTGVTISNGIGWSPDRTVMYYVDSPTQGLDCFPYDLRTGQIGERRRLATIPAEKGVPDGISVDAAGYIWVAVWGGWGIYRYAPDGTLDRTIPVPAAQSSSCTFGGPGLTDLYITTATEGLSAEQLAGQPHAGGLFRCRAGIAGQPTHAFAG